MKRASRKEMYLREQEIVSLIAIGFTRADIAEQLAPKFKVSNKTVERQYDSIIESWVLNDKDQIDQAKANYIMRLEGLYQKACKDKMWKTASEIIEKQAKIMGIYSPKAATKEAAPTINIVSKNGLSVVPKVENGS